MNRVFRKVDGDAIPDVVKYGLEAYAGKKLIVDPLLEMYKNRGGPVSN